MSARDKFRADVVEVLTVWRFDNIPPRPDYSAARDGLRDIIALRVMLAYLPLLQVLARIENRWRVLCDLRADPYAPRVKK